MALFPLAVVSDLAAWVGRVIPDNDPRAGAVLSHASTKVRTYTGRAWDDGEIPAVIREVTVRVAARALRNPDEADSVTIDDGTLRGLRGLVLTDEDKSDLGPYRVRDSLPSGIGTVGTYRGDLDLGDTIYVPTGPPPSGYPFPFLSSSDA